MDEPRFGGFAAAAAAASGGGSGAGAGAPSAKASTAAGTGLPFSFGGVGKPAAARTAQKDWEWEDGPHGSGQWQCYSPGEIDLLNKACSSARPGVVLKISGTIYAVDFEARSAGAVGCATHGTQTRSGTGFVRAIRCNSASIMARRSKVERERREREAKVARVKKHNDAIEAKKAAAMAAAMAAMAAAKPSTGGCVAVHVHMTWTFV